MVAAVVPLTQVNTTDHGTLGDSFTSSKGFDSFIVGPRPREGPFASRRRVRALERRQRSSPIERDVPFGSKTARSGWIFLGRTQLVLEESHGDAAVANDHWCF